MAKIGEIELTTLQVHSFSGLLNLIHSDFNGLKINEIQPLGGALILSSVFVSKSEYKFLGQISASIVSIQRQDFTVNKNVIQMALKWLFFAEKSRNCPAAGSFALNLRL